MTMAATKKKGIDSSKFEGNGISFKAKLIGTEDVAEARGDLLCQETITKLKNSVKISGQHKQKIFINVTLEGLKIIDAISLANNQNKKKADKDTRTSKTSVNSEENVKTDDMLVLHTHAVHRISFISRDTTDNRAFGYIIGSGEGKHTFFAIKTAAAAEQLVLTLRDLFQVVYELKKKEMDAAKEKIDESNKEENSAENEKPSGEGSTSEGGQTQTQTGAPAAADADGVYHVPQNNAPVNGSLEEQQANLLELEDQADSILKGIEQIKNLEFDSITNNGDLSPTSSMSPPPSKPGTADPWAAPAPGTSALGDLAGIQTGPFVNMPRQPFPPGASFPGQQMPGQMPGQQMPGQMPGQQMPGQMPGQQMPGQMPGYNVPGYNMPNAGLPVSRDPFGSDPFGASFQQPGMRPGMTSPQFPAANPFGAPAFGQQPFPGNMPGAVRPGMFPPTQSVAANQNPFANSAPQEDPSLLKPIRNDPFGQEIPQDADKARSKSPREDLFGDLVGIKKSTKDATTPKDMFAQLTSAEKKPMNQLMNAAEMPPQNTNANAFADAFVAPPQATKNGNPPSGALLD